MALSKALIATAAALAIAGAAQAGGSPAETGLPKPANSAPAAEVAGVVIPDGPLAAAAAQAVRGAESELVYQHSLRVYHWATLAAKRRGLAVDPQLLYVASLFHDFGLTDRYRNSHLRFEVDGANAAREFLLRHGASAEEAQRVWLAIALHTTNGVSSQLEPMAAVLAESANMDLVAAGYDAFTPGERRAVEAAFPREPDFAEGFLQTLYEGLKHRPETTQGTGLADVMAYKDPAFRRRDFSVLVRTSRWTAKP
ncbi:HD domain-containing protein [Phenylobacterium sp.]|uniref:HD domain-containing protein n=1 Tax=Phenylobacterium sp. TaxID=1871053 RepID=UPI0035AF1DD6